jgi:hypothetical protein
VFEVDLPQHYKRRTRRESSEPPATSLKVQLLNKLNLSVVNIIDPGDECLVCFQDRVTGVRKPAGLVVVSLSPGFPLYVQNPSQYNYNIAHLGIKVDPPSYYVAAIPKTADYFDVVLNTGNPRALFCGTIDWLHMVNLSQTMAFLTEPPEGYYTLYSEPDVMVMHIFAFEDRSCIESFRIDGNIVPVV